jgi:DNA-directed RNA polymerase II subunit RPB2
MLAASGEIEVTLPYVQAPIPLVVLFRAMGEMADRDILEKVAYRMDDVDMLNLLKPSLAKAYSVQTQEVALDLIGRRCLQIGASRSDRIRHAREILQRELLPHCGLGEASEAKKVFFLGYMVHRLLLSKLGRREEDDRDHYASKRLDLAGPLLSVLFRKLFLKLADDMKKVIEKDIEMGRVSNVTMSVNQATIANGLKYALATGNWGMQKDGSVGVKTGVSQVLSRLTFASSLSHLRRTNTPIGRDGKLAKPRQLHNSHWGMVCPAETPEGQACGLVKNLALMAYVSVAESSENVRLFLDESAIESLEELLPANMVKSTKVFVNGDWMGVHREPVSLVSRLRELRRSGELDPQISITHDVGDREIHIYSDQGRCLRPLFIVDQDVQCLRIKRAHIAQLEANAFEESNFNWSSLISEGLVEYLDTAEESTCMIAMKIEDVHDGRTKANAYCRTYTHCEIHPSLILGVCASIIPFPDHNQSPRNTYQSAMGKQAMGIYITNFQQRMDTLAHVLNYPQKPLVTTRAMEYLHFRDLPAGINSVVAIACYTGYNQEDSVLMNRGSIDRGLYRSTFYRTYIDHEKLEVGARGVMTAGGGGDAMGRTVETFERPSRDTTTGMGARCYDKIDVDGLPAPGTRVDGNDIIIGKSAELPESADMAARDRAQTRKDASQGMRPTESGIVDHVMLSTDEMGVKMTKIRVRSTRVPQIGDKFSSRHGQKGTCGMTIAPEDMPFSVEGISPDIIMNPHAVPSRMTIGQLVECILSKVAAIQGDEGDSTPFTDFTVSQVSEALHSLGYQRRGYERLYNGQTGRPLESLIFMGPTYYQRLKHMVDDKIHARARGPNTLLTRQPMEGRGRDGGLRFGEMERDCIMAHGGSAFLRDRLLDNSDRYRVHVCDLCGLMCVAKLKEQVFTCKRCNKSSVSQVFVPYAFKLLAQELQSMAVVPRLMVRK